MIFIADGTPLSDLDKSIVANLPASIKNDGGTIKFVGFMSAIDQAGDDVFFLPKGCDTSDLTAARRAARDTMRVVAQFMNERERQSYSDSAAPETVGEALPPVIQVVEDYQNYGLLDRPQFTFSASMVDPDWDETFAKRPIYFDSEQRVSITDIISTSMQHLPTGILSVIHKWVLQDIADRHGWWLGFDPMFDDSQMFQAADRDMMIAVVDRALDGDLSDRFRDTLSLLRRYIVPQGSAQGDSDLVGIRDFSSVWEWMLKEQTKRLGVDVTKNLPSISYFDNDGVVSFTARSLFPDILCELGDHHVIVDAKYYTAIDRNTSPLGEDILKQNAYLQALRSIPDIQGRIENMFCFPALETGKGPLSRVGFSNGDNTYFQPIHCRYIGTAELMASCVEGREMRGFLDLL
jgi:hypothetical protein